jgi:hypothetical protein
VVEGDEVNEPKIRVISLGAGVQSSTMALMAARGELGPMPDAAIFADTGWEPKNVYNWLQWLQQQLPFPVYHVTAGNLRDHLIAKSNSTGQRFSSVPFFMRLPNGKEAMGRRQCTAEYKLRPIQRKVVEMMGGKRPKGGAEVWVGISTDEVIRMKDSRVQYITNRWPLIEARLSRADCLRWFEKNNLPKPPKSSCIGCPFHSDAQWRQLRDEDPQAWADAVEVDRAIREQVKGKGEQFMHRSCKPLDRVDLRTDAEIGQADMFNNECEGMCGV